MRGAPRRLGRRGRPQGRRRAAGPALRARGKPERPRGGRADFLSPWEGACSGAAGVRARAGRFSGGSRWRGQRRSRAGGVGGCCRGGRWASRRHSGRSSGRAPGEPPGRGARRFSGGPAGGCGAGEARWLVGSSRRAGGTPNADERIWGRFEDCPPFPSFPPSPCLSWLHWEWGWRGLPGEQILGQGGQAGEVGALGPPPPPPFHPWNFPRLSPVLRNVSTFSLLRFPSRPRASELERGPGLERSQFLPLNFSGSLGFDLTNAGSFTFRMELVRRANCAASLGPTRLLPLRMLPSSWVSRGRWPSRCGCV